MKIQLKRLVGTKWKPVKIEELVGTSITNFILESEEAVIAALFEEDNEKEAVAFMSNDIEHLHRYKLQGKLCLEAHTLKELMGTDVSQPLIAKVFPDSNLVSVSFENKGG